MRGGWRLGPGLVLGLVASGTLGMAAAPAEPDGRALFHGKGNCYACHGQNGVGTPLGPDLTDGEWLNTQPVEADVVALIRAGVPQPKQHPAPMPPMGGASLNEEEMVALARYVLDIAGGE